MQSMNEGETTRIGQYTVEKIRPEVYAIDDDQMESMYLVCGKDKALLIDTGSNPEPVMPVVRALWNGPVELALTHAHFDHMYHCDEFSTVYVGEADVRAWYKTLWLVVWLGTVGSGKKAKHYPMRSYRCLNAGDGIDLGGKTLRVLAAEGHTPGSLIYVDESDRCLFIGDAFGWMWMPGCSVLSKYMESLDRMIPELEPYSGFFALDGHRIQNTPKGMTVKDLPSAHESAQYMKALCEKILSGSIRPAKTERYFGFRTETYQDDKISIVIRKSKQK